MTVAQIIAEPLRTHQPQLSGQQVMQRVRAVMAVVKHISRRILVMYLGREMELTEKHALYDSPRHPYTRALLSAIPIPDPERERGKVIQLLVGDLPSPINPPSGCVFRTRCPQAEPRCAERVPPLKSLDGHSQAACLLNE